jgi:flagellar motility protein MotE (MotC chaperone)
MLWSAASEYESEKSQFKSACDPDYGYSKNDESACGAYGYLRSGYIRAARSLQDALDNVAIFCGPCDNIIRAARSAADKELLGLKKELADMEEKLKKLEAENDKLRKAEAPP